MKDGSGILPLVATISNQLMLLLAIREYLALKLNTECYAILYVVPDAPPASVTIVSVTNSSISIRWDPVECLRQNSILGGYQVLYESAEVYPEKQRSSGIIMVDNSFTMVGLESNTSYSFQVFPVVVGLLDDEVPGTGLISVWTRVCHMMTR